MAKKKQSLLKSRKVKLAVAAILLVVLNRVTGLNLDPADLALVILPLTAVIVGIAWEDAAEKRD